jgi:hypothetical protein
METHKFFEYGEVSLIAVDEVKRQVALHICMPCCLMHTITPAMLGGGHIDKYELRNPIAVWMPPLQSDNYVDLANKVVRINNMNKLIKTKLDDIMKTFEQLSQDISPADIIPMLPMGIYVKFRFRCQIDKITGVLLNLENTLVMGVYEFRLALTGVLQTINS